MKKLIEIIDYIIEQHEQCISSTSKTYNYAIFLKQPLELWMFVPCDEDGNVLEVVPYYADGVEKVNEYKKAKERCLFEDCIYDEEMQVIRKDCGIDLFYIPKPELFTIETMTNYDLTLTQTAIKQIL